VNAIALGWAFGWLAGLLLCVLLYILLVFYLGVASAESGSSFSDKVFYVIVGVVVLLRSMLSPLGSVIAVRRWRRKAEAKFAGKKGLVAPAKAA
jgi:hypothetical protein